MTRGVPSRSFAQLGMFIRFHLQCVSTITRTTRDVPIRFLTQLDMFVRSHLSRCAPLDTRYYYYVSNGKLIDHLVKLVVGPLLDIFIYSLFSEFNILGNGRGSGKLANDGKDM